MKDRAPVERLAREERKAEDWKYSVLMSVYYKEKAEFLRESMESMLLQTIPTDDFVLVCDGPLDSRLDAVIDQMQEKFRDTLHVVRLEKNCGLGNALNIGMKYCRNPLVARMDSDDISYPDRCERQIKVFQQHPEISVLSGAILEFQDIPEMVTGKRALPELHSDICRFSKKRNPFNHPAVMFKKTAVDAAGGYRETYPLFEDYYLWIRMLQNGSIAYNLKDPVLYMRTPPDLYLRRGGAEYARNMLAFHQWVFRSGWSGKTEYLSGVLPHAVICMLPNCIRKTIYRTLHKA